VRGNDIAMIFQEPMTSLNPLHTVERQVGETLRLHGAREADIPARTLELLDQVGIRDAAKRLRAYPHQLSGGQRQRVMIAMALANQSPELLIADEPTTALDVTVQAQILKLLDDLKREEGMSMLFITHDLGIVRRIADRVCVMTDGKIVETGPTEEIFANPQHDYTKHLLAAEPKGEPIPLNDNAATVLTGDDVKVWFPIRKGLLRKTVDNVKAVDGVDVTVRAGQTLGIVGESGSGKTTLGLALTRMISSRGKITFGDQSIDAYSFEAMRPLRAKSRSSSRILSARLSPRMSIDEIIGRDWASTNRNFRATSATTG
jgi:microcin C transport system ATP-binding protein